MPRARLIPPEFWTSEAVVDCTPMARLLLLGLNNFADDFGVLPLRPRTLRYQLFPGDAIDDEQMRGMIDELVTRGLVRRYTVDGADYLSILDWAVHQRIHKRARRRYPAHPSDVAGPAPASPPGIDAVSVAAEAEAAPADNPPPAPDADDPPPTIEREDRTAIAAQQPLCLDAVHDTLTSTHARPVAVAHAPVHVAQTL